LAYVRLDHQQIYLGVFGSEESHAEYDRLTSLWMANGRKLPSDARPENSRSSAQQAGDPPAVFAIAHLCNEYLGEAEEAYVRDGVPTTEMDRIRQVMKVLLAMFARLPAAEFGPKKFKMLRKAWVEQGLSRSEVNKRLRTVRRIFAFGVEEELVEGNIWHALLAVRNLKAGTTSAREPRKVRPVEEWLYGATLPFLSRIVRAMVEVQVLTGMRSGEVCLMRGSDIDMAGDIWQYRPTQHKTRHRGVDRVVPIGPQAQAILRPFIAEAGPAKFLFRPETAMREHRANCSERRVTPESCGNVPGSHGKQHPKRQAGNRYTAGSYGRAVRNACRQAFPLPERLDKQLVTPQKGRKRQPRLETEAEWRTRLSKKEWEEVLVWWKQHHWHPHQLRHTTATRVRKNHGLDAVQALLGHKHISTTEVYAELDVEKAVQAMRNVG
jgi:integrase